MKTNKGPQLRGPLSDSRLNLVAAKFGMRYVDGKTFTAGNE